MSEINIFKGNVTAGLTDGTVVSRGNGSTPITTNALDAIGLDESDPIKLAIRCDAGFKTDGNTTISFIAYPGLGEVDTSDRWAIAPDAGGSHGAWSDWNGQLVIADPIGDVNKIFWVKARSKENEEVANDPLVNIKVQTVITPA